MNEQFRVAQKIGLMFHHDTHLPEDVKSWAISQLHSKSPALGVSNSFSKKIEEWPQSLQPDLIERAELFRLLQGTYLKNREIKNKHAGTKNKIVE